MKKIPTYLIHGSLGSGKTTLLKTLLQSQTFKNSIVIENEYASYNLDKQSFPEDVNVYEVSGGCICCSHARDLFNVLQKAALETKVDHLFIETTGVASSAQLIKQLLLSSEFDQHFQLVRNIYVIDALVYTSEEAFESMTKEKSLDIAMADLIVLNKTDLVAQEKVNTFTKYVKNISNSPVISTKNGNIDTNIVISDTISKSHDIIIEHFHALSEQFSDHSQDILYQALFPKHPFDKEKLIEIIKDLQKTQSILRVKGVFTHNDDRQYEIQMTEHHQEIKPFMKRNQSDVIILIGKNLTRDKIALLEQYIC